MTSAPRSSAVCHTVAEVVPLGPSCGNLSSTWRQALRIDFRGGVKLGTGEVRTLQMGPPKNPNFPWVLLNGVLSRYQRMLPRAHGRRNEEVLEGGTDGLANSLSIAR